ncbi:hypothetical protein DXG01_002695 [Tephrocybe rancida]|nr:hypothetical protein DXG01_002695 [Tephrocybe rancida]
MLPPELIRNIVKPPSQDLQCPQLAPELIINIFDHLSLRDLFRCRLASQTFYQLVLSHIRRHLHSLLETFFPDLKDQDAFWKIVTRGHAVLTGPIVTALYGPASSAPRLHSLTILAQDGLAFDAVLDFFDKSPFVEKSTPPDTYPGFATCFLLGDLEVHIQDVRFKHEVYEPAFNPQLDFPGILTHQSLLLTTPFEEPFHNTPFFEPFYTGHSVLYRGRRYL